MPLTIPTLDDRKYQDLLDEALARIPVHTPEWTNFNKSDPGVTLIEIFAFLTENLLYRSNQIPERNRRKFLKLLGIPLQPAGSARGLVTFANERGPLQTLTLNAGLEVRAGQVPFRTTQGLDVLPIEAQVFYKRELVNPSDQLRAYYNQLYASFLRPPLSGTAQLYETALFAPPGASGIDLGRETIDGSLWIALLARAADRDRKEKVQEQIGGKTLSLGIVPSLADANRHLAPGRQATPEGLTLLTFEMPIGGTLSALASERLPRYRILDTSAPTDVLTQPGIVQITLPAAAELKLWDNLDPLESGTMDFPPALEDTNLADRLITWLRVRSSAQVRTSAAARMTLLWVGINATPVSQRARVSHELLPSGTGTPDQVVMLSKTPVIPDSVQLTVTINGKSEAWEEIDDLASAGPEVPVPNPRQPPGSALLKPRVAKVFTVNAESGELSFGDGLRGARPPLDAILRADYDYGVGRDGNVNAGSINSGPALPAGIKVTNPVATWGGAEAESVSEGEKHIASYLQHRDRLVNTGDFETITRRTPGVDIGRVDVLPAFNPELGSNEPGDAPGSVTLMIIPKYDPLQPDAPLPDRLFLDTICAYIDSRRLVTTEVFLRGPTYKPIWVSIGINVVPGQSIAEVREAVKRDMLRFLAPLPRAQNGALDDPAAWLTTPQYADLHRGWPLRRPVVALELLAVASRVPGVSLVNNVLLAEDPTTRKDQVDMRGLQLPRVMGFSVVVGDPLALDQLSGRASLPTDQGPSDSPRLVPVPVIPEECR
jgi:hypothetical protein